MRMRAAAVLAGVAVAVAVPAAASAHVRVDDGSAPGAGGHGVVRLIVPTESESASTVGLTVTIPDGTGLTSAQVLPVVGWSASVEKSAAGQVTRIVWRAAKGGGLGPSEFGIFTFSAGPWPANLSAVPLPTTQRYSDGSAVAWDEVAVDAVSEPEHPAPVVTLAAAAANHHGAVAAGVHQPVAASSDTGAGGPEAAQWFLIGLAVLVSVATYFRRGR